MKPLIPAFLALAIPLAQLQAAAVSNATATLDNRQAEDRSQRPGRFSRGERGVYKAQINPHWFHNNTRFWYRNDLRTGAREFVLVDAERGTRQAAFDHQRLALALSKAAGEEFQADRLPFSEIEFRGDGSLRFQAAGRTWRCDLDTYNCVAVEAPDTQSGSSAAQDSARGAREPRRRFGQGDSGNSRRSPDERHTAFVKDHNVFIRSGSEGTEFQLTQDGGENHAYGRLEWSPDSKVLVCWRIEPGDNKEVYLVQSSPPGGGRATFRARPYALPGDKLRTFELSLLDVANRKQIKPAVDRFEHGWESPRLHWYCDSARFAYMQVDRGHQRLRVIEVDAATGALRNIIDEKSETFIWTTHTENLRLDLVNWLEKSDELIYVSERDGWRHLYLADLKEGRIRHQITKGEYVVRGIDRIDEDARQIWFSASGKNPGQDPYFLHYYRVNFDGTELVALTEGDGNHSVQYSPDRKFVIDTFSRVDMAPKHELRRTADGARICGLEEADASELRETGWQPPEVFVSKARDGKTDIWGIICRPKNLDPSKKYPVIEQIYAGPQGAYVPKTFSSASRFSSLTDLGFIVVQVDAMGTAFRSKAFHDVCWKNLKDAGFPDRILWLKAAAAKYPCLDLSRVGIYGNSAGGQNAAAAVLFHPEFYKAAVASCGCHDNRMDKASWNEQWMGYPVGPQYAECSNIENAARLRGKLFLIVGEMDDNVPPESTMRFADALIKAGKDFDLLVIPGAGHGMGGSYGQRRLQDFFVRHLLGKEPPDRNAIAAPSPNETNPAPGD